MCPPNESPKQKACPVFGPVFKGWRVPGPEVPGGLAPEEGETLDAISGQFRIFQLAEGHRFSTDDVLTAWYGTMWCPRADRVLDLGSGIGSVAQVAAWRLPGAYFVTIEAQEQSVKLARKSIRYNGLESRFDVRQFDFRDPDALSENEQFDLILGSPPYFPLGSGVLAEHPQKIACRFETRGSIHDYCGVASQHLSGGGVFACVFPAAQDDRVREAARASGLSLVRYRDVILREGEAPLLRLYVMSASRDLPEAYRDRPWIELALVIRTSEGKVHPEYSAVKLSFGFPPG